MLSRGRARQDVKAPRLDPVEDRQTAAREQVDVDGQGARHPRHQGPALAEQVSGPLDLELHQGGERRGEASGVEVVVGVAEPLAVLAGQVDPADRQVAGHVLPEVGQLQPGAGGVGEPGVLGVEGAGQVEDQVAHRVRRPRAVIEQLREGRILGDLLVLLERRDQRLERVRSGWRTPSTVSASAIITG